MPVDTCLGASWGRDPRALVAQHLRELRPSGSVAWALGCAGFLFCSSPRQVSATLAPLAAAVSGRIFPGDKEFPLFFILKAHTVPWALSCLPPGLRALSPPGARPWSLSQCAWPQLWLAWTRLDAKPPGLLPLGPQPPTAQGGSRQPPGVAGLSLRHPEQPPHPAAPCPL